MATATRTVTILVVDDDPRLARLFFDLLSDEGYRVETALSGPEALRRAAAAPPDLLLVDLMMPEMAGDEVVRRLCGLPCCDHTRVVLMSAHVDLRARAAGLGVDALLTKPFRLEELRDRIEQALGPVAPRPPLRLEAVGKRARG